MLKWPLMGLNYLCAAEPSTGVMVNRIKGLYVLSQFSGKFNCIVCLIVLWVKPVVHIPNLKKKENLKASPQKEEKIQLKSCER